MAIVTPNSSSYPVPVLHRDIMYTIIGFLEEPRDIITCMRVSKATKAIAESLMPFPEHYQKVIALSRGDPVPENSEPISIELVKKCYMQRLAAMKVWYTLFGGKAGFMALPVLDTSDLTTESSNGYPDELRGRSTEAIMRGNYFGRRFISFSYKTEGGEGAMEELAQLMKSRNRNSNVIFFERELDGTWAKCIGGHAFIGMGGRTISKGIPDNEEIASVTEFITTGKFKTPWKIVCTLTKPEVKKVPLPAPQ